MNTQLPIDRFTKSYGFDLENQNTLLDKMDNFITNMKVHGSNRRLPFQTGIFLKFICTLHTTQQFNFIFISRHIGNKCFDKKSVNRFEKRL